MFKEIKNCVGFGCKFLFYYVGPQNLKLHMIFFFQKEKIKNSFEILENCNAIGSQTKNKLVEKKLEKI